MNRFIVSRVRRDLFVVHHADEVIRKGELRGRAHLRHMAAYAVAAALVSRMGRVTSVTIAAPAIVSFRRVALCIQMGRMAGGALDIAVSKTRTLHQTQRLETDVGGIAFVA